MEVEYSGPDIPEREWESGCAVLLDESQLNYGLYHHGPHRTLDSIFRE